MLLELSLKFKKRAKKWSLKKQALLRTQWNKTLDAYLLHSDKFFAQGSQLARTTSQRVVHVCTQSRLVQPGSNLLLKFTFAAIILVFVCVLVSCQSTQPQGRPKQRSMPSRGVEKRGESLYVKRETLNIAPKETGSKTGSMWADAQQPRQLFADARPSKQGDLITVHIPDELQFKDPMNNSAAASKSQPGKGAKNDPKSAGAKGKTAEKSLAEKDASGLGKTGGAAPGDANSAAQMADLTKGGAGQEFRAIPVESFKMEIVGIESTGDVYLRGQKTFQNNLGETHNLLILAKIPKRSLTSFDIDAHELTQIAVNEEANGQTSDYAAPGWDATVSRKLSGFAPDIEAELAALEDVRQELGVAQSALKDQAKALADERERLRKERGRMALQEQQRASGASGAGTEAAPGGAAGAAGAPAGAGAAGGAASGAAAAGAAASTPGGQAR